MKKPMKFLRQITLCFALVFFVSIDALAFQVTHINHYVSIDTLTMNYASRQMNLDLKTRELDVLIENEIVTFVQTYDATDTLFHHLLLVNDLENVTITLRITELLSIDNDSIYVSAVYQQFNKRGNISGEIKIENLAISKSDLLGIAFSPPMEVMRKANNRMLLMIGGFLGSMAIVALILDFFITL